MSELRLRFRDGDQPDLPIGPGVHALGRRADGLGPVEADAPWLLQLCNDRRGLWLTLAEDARGVHVNGRPVRHVAMLRAGDCIHVDGNELLLASTAPRAPLPARPGPRDPVGDLRHALRGLGGNHHGRSLSLDAPRRIGRAADADLRIDGPGIAEQHARIEVAGGQVLLRADPAGVLVNGERLREAVLQAGDQLAFDVQHRFVLEGPPPEPAAAGPRPRAPAPEHDGAPPPRHWTQRVPWLLVAALLLAGGLSGLLLFGAR